jgi:hypothetical protein
MDYLIKDQKLELKYEPNKGAWTYHIQIPNTKHIIGKWGSLKVSGFIDDYKIENINLFTRILLFFFFLLLISLLRCINLIFRIYEISVKSK